MQAVYMITELNAIIPAELSRETDNDEELTYVRSLIINNQLSQLPEPYRTYHNTLSSSYGLVSQDDKLIIPQGLPAVFVNLLHKDHTGLDRMEQAAPYITWKTMDANMRRKITVCRVLPSW